MSFPDVVRDKNHDYCVRELSPKVHSKNGYSLALEELLSHEVLYLRYVTKEFGTIYAKIPNIEALRQMFSVLKDAQPAYVAISLPKGEK